MAEGFDNSEPGSVVKPKIIHSEGIQPETLNILVNEGSSIQRKRAPQSQSQTSLARDDHYLSMKLSSARWFAGRAMTAANEAFEADLDLVVALGWAHIESHAYKTLWAEAQAAVPSLKPALLLLTSLYGLTRLERSIAHYLAAGVLQGT